MQLYILPAHSPPSAYYSIYNACFDLWESVWSSTLRELDGLEVLFSDAFTRQDFFGAAFVQGKPAALCCFKNLDLGVSSSRKDSWFAPWPKDLLEELAQEFPQALIPSWMTVHPDFRKTANYQGPNFGLLMSELISLCCLHQGADIAFGTPRKDRSVNKLVSQAGATCLVPDVKHHGVLVDLVAFFPEKLKDLSFSQEIQSLWQNRIHLQNPTTQKEKIYESSL